MIGIVVAAHGELARALVEAAQLVVQERARVVAVGITSADDSAQYQARLREALDEVKGDGGVLVLTDMFGGTPSNIGLTMHEPGAVEVLTGANLPMLVKALQLSHRNVDLASASRQVRESGQRAISVASEILSGGVSTSKEDPQ